MITLIKLSYPDVPDIEFATQAECDQYVFDNCLCKGCQGEVTKYGESVWSTGCGCEYYTEP